MDDPSFVTAAQSQQQLDQPVQNLLLRQIGANGLACAQMRMQITARAVLHDDVQRILLEEGLAVANDEGVRFRTAQPLERLHFSQRGQTLRFRQRQMIFQPARSIVRARNATRGWPSKSVQVIEKQECQLWSGK